jgi:hypothetical protein
METTPILDIREAKTLAVPHDPSKRYERRRANRIQRARNLLNHEPRSKQGPKRRIELTSSNQPELKFVVGVECVLDLVVFSSRFFTIQ